MLFCAMLTMMLASCSNDEVVSFSQDGISYGVSAGKQTRALDSYCNIDLPDAFYVWAGLSSDKTIYINGDNIVSDGGNPVKWTDADGMRYWPNDGTALDFFAEVNGDTEFRYNNGAPTFDDFVVNDVVTEQVDLLYAVKKNQTKSNGTVHLNFRHALSQVVFQARNETSKLYVEISGVSVGHLDNTGTFTFPADNTDENYTNHTDNPDAEDINVGSWEVEKGANKRYDVNFTAVPVPNNSQTVNLTCPGDQHINGFKNVMTLLPQEQEAWNPMIAGADYNGAYFLVKCNIYNIAGDEYAEGDLKLNTYEYAAIPVDIVWEPGRRYIYTFVFKEGGNGGYAPDPENPQPVLTNISYEIGVDDFIPVDEGDSEMNAGITQNTFTLKYDANGGEGTKTVMENSSETTYTFKAIGGAGFSKSDYEFLGWADDADAAEVDYAEGAEIEVTTTTSPKTVYAVWKALDKYNYALNFVAGDGAIGAPEDLSQESTADFYEFTIPATNLYRDNYKFLGWADTEGATETNEAYAVGNKVTVTKDAPVKTLYAVWEAVASEFVLKFDGNKPGDTETQNLPGNMTAAAVGDNYEFTLPATVPTNGNWKFMGWSETDTYDATTKFYQPGEIFVVTKESSPKTLYAAWGAKGSGGGAGGGTGEDW